MDNILAYVKPELLVLVPVLCFVGAGLKKSARFAAKHIPLVLGGAGIVLAGLWVAATSPPAAGWQNVLQMLFTAVVQGLLCAGLSVYAHQLIKQNRSPS